MRCCDACFHSPQLKHVINTSGELGDCDFCKKQRSQTIDSRELFFKVSAVLDLYTPDPNGKSIGQRLLEDFPDTAFASKSPADVVALLEAVCSEDLDAYGPLLNGPVILRSELDPENQSQVSALVASWESFCAEIKSVNRFHLKNILDLDQLEKLLSAIKVRLNAGKIVYRARLSTQGGFLAAEMGNPPSVLATPGRANPVGISYLYTAGDEETALFEVRAGLYDYVTIGEFRLREDVHVVDLKDVEKQDPFGLAESELLENYMTFRPFLTRLGEELSTPNRRTDTELDYIPTQYLAEFIKSLTLTLDDNETVQEFDGIGYSSSLNATGHNFAMFNPEKFECIKVTVHEISQITLTHHAL